MDSSVNGNEPNNNRIADSTVVTLAGGTFNLKGSAAVATSETIGGLALGSGLGNVNVSNGQTTTLTIGGTGIARAIGGAVNFSSTASGTILVPSFSNASSGIARPWATIGSESIAAGAGSGLDFATG